MPMGAIGRLATLGYFGPGKTYGRPHLHLQRHTGHWRCRDTYGNRGYGVTPQTAYNCWVDMVQFRRLAEGYFPAPLNKVHVTLQAAHK